MCVARCSRFVGVSLVPIAILSMIANALLLFPNLETQYLLENHLTPEATWGTGLWASGFLVLTAARSFMFSTQKNDCCGFRMEMVCQIGVSIMAVAAAGVCFFVSLTGLANGPLCLHNTTQGLIWDQPLKLQIDWKKNYLYDPSLWDSACERPQRVVLWHVVFFVVLVATSGIQMLLCASHAFNALLGMLCGRSFGRNKVGPA